MVQNFIIDIVEYYAEYGTKWYGESNFKIFYAYRLRNTIRRL